MFTLVKRDVIREIQTYLIQELAKLAEEDDQQEAVARRIGEIQRQILQYQLLPVREYGTDDVVCPAALVEIDLEGNRTFCFIVPQGGGLVLKVQGKPIQVLTPNSPLGEALLGKRVGETAQVELTGRGTRNYRVVSIS